jgi:hypothetical protein
MHEWLTDSQQYCAIYFLNPLSLIEEEREPYEVFAYHGTSP